MLIYDRRKNQDAGTFAPEFALQTVSSTRCQHAALLAHQNCDGLDITGCLKISVDHDTQVGSKEWSRTGSTLWGLLEAAWSVLERKDFNELCIV